MLRSVQPPTVGISRIAVYEPPWVLGNDWFANTLARKFVQHTGIQSRHVSVEDETAMAVRAVRKLQEETGCDLRDCAALVFVSPSLIERRVARHYFDESVARRESTNRAAWQLVHRLGIPAAPSRGINWGCSGYSKSFSLLRRHLLPPLRLGREEFILVVTASRISRITDYACKETGPLFGDLATATLVSRVDSTRHPVRFELLFAAAGTQSSQRTFFDYHWREDILTPAPGGGRSRAPRRLVFFLDGLGIADAAPRAMALATARAIRAARLGPEELRFIVPHQAGTGIVRFTAMKLEELGIRGEVINGLTSEVGNVSSCSIPYALLRTWDRLEGTIACPTAGVGAPGAPTVSYGCILLRAVASRPATCPPPLPAERSPCEPGCQYATSSRSRAVSPSA
jgi:3-oxoacyl-[acyl-carrier-protein] synthase-3